jgi:uncharacterized coiled-coil protein SlyX
MAEHDAAMPRKSATKTRGRPFAPGNPGKPRGARHRTTKACAELLEADAGKVTKKCIAMALKGDPTAMRLVIERIMPKREHTVAFQLPPIASASDAVAAMAAVIGGLACGELAPSEAASVASLVGTFAKIVETAEFEARLTALEARTRQ